MFDSLRTAREGGRAGSHFTLGSATTGHLATEAIAAYVDGELKMGAHLRASGHISECAQCAAEVDAQRHARAVLQQSAAPHLPESLLGHLRSIPQHTAPIDEEPPGDSGGPAWRRRLF